MAETRAAVLMLAGALASAGPSAAQLLRPSRAEAAAVVAASPLVRGRTVRAAVEIRVEDGYHVNANPASEEFLIATTVELADPRGLEIVAVFYPEAQLRSFGFWPGPLRVYEGSIVAGLSLRITEEATLGPRDLRFVVHYQACNDEACFAPATATYDLPLEVAEAGAAWRPVQSPLLARARFGDESR